MDKDYLLHKVRLAIDRTEKSYKDACNNYKDGKLISEGTALKWRHAYKKQYQILVLVEQLIINCDSTTDFESIDDEAINGLKRLEVL